MANFNGQISVNGIQTFTIFVAPAAGIYFVNGQLSLPQITTDGSASAVVATVKQNGSGIYTGTAGASGFQVNQITCASGDAISVQLSSSAAVDNVPTSNAVTGQVYFGNTF